MARVLYLSYDGLAEPLGQAQILEYLVELAKLHAITLVTFEKVESDPAATARVAHLTQASGIRWIQLRYHKRFKLMSAMFDSMVGFAACAWQILINRVDIVHARGYVPGAMACLLQRVFGVKFLFDMRAFWPDQRADCGAWDRNGLYYKLAKRAEKALLLSADAVVSLTAAAVLDMKALPYLNGRQPRYEVIPTCVNLASFRPSEVGERPGRAGSFTVGCVGNVTLWYRFDDMLKAFRAIHTIRPEARLLFVNRDDHEFIRSAINSAGIDVSLATLVAARYDEVAIRIREIDVGLFFLKEFPSMNAVCPTRLGELLACGIPVMTNMGFGDARAIVEDQGAGVIVDGFGAEDLRLAAIRLLALRSDSSSSARCRQAAESHFSLGKGIASYDRLYKELASGRST